MVTAWRPYRLTVGGCPLRLVVQDDEALIHDVTTDSGLPFRVRFTPKVMQTAAMLEMMPDEKHFQKLHPAVQEGTMTRYTTVIIVDQNDQNRPLGLLTLTPQGNVVVAPPSGNGQTMHLQRNGDFWFLAADGDRFIYLAEQEDGRRVLSTTDAPLAHPAWPHGFAVTFHASDNPNDFLVTDAELALDFPPNALHRLILADQSKCESLKELEALTQRARDALATFDGPPDEAEALAETIRVLESACTDRAHAEAQGLILANAQASPPSSIYSILFWMFLAVVLGVAVGVMLS